MAAWWRFCDRGPLDDGHTAVGGSYSQKLTYVVAESGLDVLHVVLGGISRISCEVAVQVPDCLCVPHPTDSSLGGISVAYQLLSQRRMSQYVAFEAHFHHRIWVGVRTLNPTHAVPSSDVM